MKITTFLGIQKGALRSSYPHYIRPPLAFFNILPPAAAIIIVVVAFDICAAPADADVFLRDAVSKATSENVAWV